jgi:hypothetical protein
LAGTDTLKIEGLFDGIDHGLYYEFSDEDITGSVDSSGTEKAESLALAFLHFAVNNFAFYYRPPVPWNVSGLPSSDTLPEAGQAFFG